MRSDYARVAARRAVERASNDPIRVEQPIKFAILDLSYGTFAKAAERGELGEPGNYRSSTIRAMNIIDGWATADTYRTSCVTSHVNDLLTYFHIQ